MAVIRPPVTGDVQLDSWMNQVNENLNSGVGSLAASGTGGTTTPTTPSTGNNINSANLILYKGTNVEPPAFPSQFDLEAQVIYTYATASLADANGNTMADATNLFNGWTRTFPMDSDLTYVYAIQVVIADTADTEVIEASSWSNPLLVFERDAGRDAAILSLSIRQLPGSDSLSQAQVDTYIASYVRETNPANPWSTISLPFDGDGMDFADEDEVKIIVAEPRVGGQEVDVDAARNYVYAWSRAGSPWTPSITQSLTNPFIFIKVADLPANTLQSQFICNVSQT